MDLSSFIVRKSSAKASHEFSPGLVWRVLFTHPRAMPCTRRGTVVEHSRVFELIEEMEKGGTMING